MPADVSCFPKATPAVTRLKLTAVFNSTLGQEREETSRIKLIIDPGQYRRVSLSFYTPFLRRDTLAFLSPINRCGEPERHLVGLRHRSALLPFV
jgi:hypothetical protein